MSTVATLRPAFPGRVWKETFVEALTRHLPEINPDAADEASDTTYAASRRMLQPDVAAREWAAKFLNRGASVCRSA